MSAEDNRLHLRPATLDELPMLSDLCLRSKAVWGYDAAFLGACHAELTLAPADLISTQIQVAVRDCSPVAVAQVLLKKDVASLDKLFVEPSEMGSGAGRALFVWATSVASHSGAKVLLIESDPGAAHFYRHMGAIDDGQVPSGSIPGRMIPRLKLKLDPS